MKRESKQLLNGTPVKRTKGSQSQLFNLPMHIICSIISRLPIKDAIRTSTLSSQFKYIWRDHTKLIFNGYTMRSNCFRRIPFDEEEFTTRVSAVLQQHSGIGVEHMQVRYALHNENSGYVDRWIKFAISSKTKELGLDLSKKSRSSMFIDSPYSFSREELYEFPCQLFCESNGPYLRCLQLTSVSLKPPADFKAFLKLKRLSLVDVNITDEDVQYLLSKCSILEFIEISYCGMLTTISTPHPLNWLEHLKVENCPLLDKIEMNCCLTTLEYIGPMVPLVFPTLSSLTKVYIMFMSFGIALDYIVAGFPSTLPHLQMLRLHCVEKERANLPLRAPKFIYLRHLRLELVVFGQDRKTDLLDYAHVLDIAPSMERLELHMWMNCPHQPYSQEDGELRSLSSKRSHSHLKFVHVTGFFGHKDQIELVLHILRYSMVLKKMKIDARVAIVPPGEEAPRTGYVQSRQIATKFVQNADERNVVEVVAARYLQSRQTAK